MTRANMLRTLMLDLVRGEKTTARGFIDYCLMDLNIPLGRILDIGARRFHISRDLMFATIWEVYE